VRGRPQPLEVARRLSLRTPLPRTPRARRHPGERLAKQRPLPRLRHPGERLATQRPLPRSLRHPGVRPVQQRPVPLRRPPRLVGARLACLGRRPVHDHQPAVCLSRTAPALLCWLHSGDVHGAGCGRRGCRVLSPRVPLAGWRFVALGRGVSRCRCEFEVCSCGCFRGGGGRRPRCDGVGCGPTRPRECRRCWAFCRRRRIGRSRPHSAGWRFVALGS
jgi:hypothetical protein